MGVGLGWLSPNYVTGPFSDVGTLMRNSHRARFDVIEIIRNGWAVSQYFDAEGLGQGIPIGTWTNGDKSVFIASNHRNEKIQVVLPDGKKAIIDPLCAISITC